MFARDRQRPAGAERLLFAQHTHTGFPEHAAFVSRFELVAEIAGEQDNVFVAMARHPFEQIVEERLFTRNFQQGFGRRAGEVAKPRALAADENHRLPDRLAHCTPALFPRPQTRSASAAARKT